VRCGKSLLTSNVDIVTKQSTPTTNQPEPELKRTQKISEVTPKPAAGTPNVTSGDQWVKPSEISRDRMRTASSSKGKSEMEKAKEAFARAEKVGIQDEEGAIVETRMLRASEVRELMQGIPTQPQTQQQPIERAPGPPTQRSMNMDHPTPPGLTPKQSPIDTLMKKESTSTPAATSSSPSPMMKPIDLEFVPEKVTQVEENQSTIMIEQTHKSPDILVTSRPVSINPTSATLQSAVREPPVQEMDEIMTCIAHPEDLHDGKIKEFISELTDLHREIQQVTASQISIGSQLDAHVRESHNKAEVKRISYESINEQLRLAKLEWDDAKGEYEKIENRRKRELSTLDDKIKNIQKRIDKAESSIKKRVGELDKVRDKIAQLQQQDN
jgi:hypothetical protein